MKIIILDGYAENPGDLSWEWLSDYADYTVYDRTPKELIIERAREADILVTNKTPIGAEVIDACPDLRFIALLSTGYNVVDHAYARKKGIPVSNIPAYSTKAVAQLVFAFILEHYNNVGLHSASVRSGEWTANPDFCYWKAPIFELDGKTIGIFGYGSIGKTVAGIARSFSMNVIATSPSHRAGCDGDVRFAEPEEILPIADIVTMHCPLTAQTQGMVNAGFISQMKRSALLINTSRGPVVNEQDLADALNSGRIAGAGCDVLSTEPPAADNPLLTAKNCFITPHIAWAPFETRTRLMDIFKGNIEAFIKGTPVNTVN